MDKLKEEDLEKDIIILFFQYFLMQIPGCLFTAVLKMYFHLHCYIAW